MTIVTKAATRAILLAALACGAAVPSAQAQAPATGGDVQQWRLLVEPSGKAAFFRDGKLQSQRQLQNFQPTFQALALGGSWPPPVCQVIDCPPRTPHPFPKPKPPCGPMALCVPPGLLKLAQPQFSFTPAEADHIQVIGVTEGGVDRAMRALKPVAKTPG